MEAMTAHVYHVHSHVKMTLPSVTLMADATACSENPTPTNVVSIK